MFVMGCYGHKLSNGVLFAHHLILDAPGGSSHLGYRRRVPIWHNPHTRVKYQNFQLCIHENIDSRNRKNRGPVPNNEPL